MFQLKLETNRKTLFFSRFRQVSVRATLQNETIPSGTSQTDNASALSALFDNFVSSHPPANTVRSLVRTYSSAVRENKKDRWQIADLRGKPHEMFKPADPCLPRRDEEELFFLSGQLLLDSDGGAATTAPFSFQVLTKFHHFQGSKTVWHELFTRVSGSVQALLPIFFDVRVSHLIGFRIDLLRIGLELYRPRFLGSIFGQTPIVEKRAYLEFTRSTIGIILDEDAVGKEPVIPFASSGLLPALSHAISASGLFSDLYTEIERRLCDEHHRSA